MYDLVIIGAGPAGMTAAIYGVRANLKTLLLDALAPGGAVINTNEVENYPGLGKINGADLSMKLYEHCMELGVEFDYKTVSSVELEGKTKRIYTEEDGGFIEAATVIIATGTKPRTLNVPGERDLAGSQVSWCAICDGAKYKDKDVVIIGGGNSAVDEGTYLASICNKVTIVTDFDLTADPVSCDYFRSLDNTEVYPFKQVTAFETDDEGKLKGVRFQDKETGENEQMVQCHGVFEYIGAIPSTQFLKGADITEAHGFIETNERMETSIPGVYGAGDCISKFLRQIVTASADGAIAAQEASGYLKKVKAERQNV